MYRLAEKRCKNFGTCGANGGATSGISQVNSELGALFASGRNLLQQGNCSAVRPVINQIVSLMTMPLVQGALRYAYKNGLVVASAPTISIAVKKTMSKIMARAPTMKNEKTRLNPTNAHTQGVSGAAGYRFLFFST